jgi:hypothetical protein
MATTSIFHNFSEALQASGKQQNDKSYKRSKGHLRSFASFEHKDFWSYCLCCLACLLRENRFSSRMTKKFGRAACVIWPGYCERIDSPSVEGQALLNDKVWASSKMPGKQFATTFRICRSGLSIPALSRLHFDTAQCERSVETAQP